MDSVNPSRLFALAYDVVPDLRAQREEYYWFWYAVSAVAILGWVLVWRLNRTRPLPIRLLSILIAVGAIVIGSVLGWAVWCGLWAWSWGDAGVGSRLVGELIACAMGGVGWCLAAGCFLCRPNESPAMNTIEEKQGSGEQDC